MKTQHNVLWLLAALLIASLVVSGCVVPAAPSTTAPAAEAPVQPAEPAAEPTAEPEPETDPVSALDPTGQEVLFWHVSTRIHEEVLLKIIEDFNTTNPYGITVVPEYGGYYGDIYKKIIAAINAPETLPDLAIAYPNQVSEYANAGVIASMDPYMNSEKYGLSQEDQDDFFQAFLLSDQYGAFNNEHLSFAHSRSMQVMYYNQEWLERLGYDGPPTTWDEFKEMCVAATDPDADTFGYAYAPSASLFAGIVFTFGGDIVSEDGMTPLFNEEAGVQTLQLLKELFESGCAYEVAERYGDQTDFAIQKALFNFGSTAGLPYYRGAVDDSGTFEWAVASPPTALGHPVVDVYGPSATIFKKTPERELAAWLFLNYWSEPDRVAEWAKIANYFPIRRSAIESEIMQEYIAENPNYQTAFDLLSYGRVEPNVAGWQAVRDLLSDAMKEAIEGGDPTTILDAKAAEAADILASQ